MNPITRTFAVIAAVAAATIVVNAQGSADTRARGQGTQAAKTIPRTPWGAPDLQ